MTWVETGKWSASVVHSAASVVWRQASAGTALQRFLDDLCLLGDDVLEVRLADVLENANQDTDKAAAQGVLGQLPTDAEQDVRRPFAQQCVSATRLEVRKDTGGMTISESRPTTTSRRATVLWGMGSG